MYFTALFRRHTIIWLNAILLVLSVAASAHSVEHVDEGAKADCTLCFHQSQIDQVLPQQDANVELISQQYEQIFIAQPALCIAHSVHYHSRAPPTSL